MSKIKELLQDKESILVFDIDGVLAVMEFGEYNHFIPDDEWISSVDNNINFYTEDKVSIKMQNFLKDKDMSRVYVVTRVEGDNEIKQKCEFANKYYNIPKSNIFGVKEDNEKVYKLLRIKEKYPTLPDKKIIMIEDTVDILNDIMDKTNFSTVHISSLLDI